MIVYEVLILKRKNCTLKDEAIASFKNASEWGDLREHLQNIMEHWLNYGYKKKPRSLYNIPFLMYS